jgi:arylsulfatase A-like enzyme
MPTRPFRGRSRAGDYGDFVAQIDDAAGQVFRAIDAAGIANNTLVVFTSDNGGYWPDDLIERYSHRSNAGWRGMKADIYDAGHRVPFIARWNGRIPAGKVRDHLGCLTDLLATCADAAGIALPSGTGEDSFSQWAALTGARQATPPRDFVIHHSSQGMFAIRQGRWKLNLGRGSGGFTKPVKIEPAPGEPPGELYDLSRDPAETVNLYQKEPAVVTRLTELLGKAKSDGRTRDETAVTV